jgi:non-lysosomal glucosylceramidase
MAATPTRREALKWFGVGAAALASNPRALFGGEETGVALERLIPPDKQLDPDWVRSLFARGSPRVYRGRELDFIGMPVGGITTGQLYLGGDGRLWHWDIFNRFIRTAAEHYEHPLTPSSPLVQGFALECGNRRYALDRATFPAVTFRGEYPIGIVEYHDPAVPIATTLEAFSPFIPLNLDDSSLPATVLRFTLRNVSTTPVEGRLTGELENGVCLDSSHAAARRRIRILEARGCTFLACSAEAAAASPRQEILFEDWSRPDFPSWTKGKAWMSRAFKIEQPFINFGLGGAAWPIRTGVRLLVAGAPVRAATGLELAPRRPETFEVAELIGQTAQLEITPPGDWEPPSAGVGPITFSDHAADPGPLPELPDYGTMGLALLGAPAERRSAEATAPLSEKLIGYVGRAFRLAPGESTTVTFVVAWHFANLALGMIGRVGRHYATRFPSALAVAEHVAANFDRLHAGTKLWRDTWYDSTLPFWLLDRTFANASTLATSTCLGFADGRFFGWEGVGNCAGTCTHVWGYAQSVARLFPELERDLRVRTDYGLALTAEGTVRYRGDFHAAPASEGFAVDGQSMVILRTLREHQMSADDAFLHRAWPGAKKALTALIAHDTDGDGLLDGAQHNTLDAQWYGEIAWLSGLFLAALRAGEELARESGDDAFAQQCRAIFERGRTKLVRDLFDDQYFINRLDPAHRATINSGTGCHIDQVLGQAWAFQVGLGRVLPEKETRTALRALWRYNYAPDVGPYRAVFKSGRWYALPGEAGLIMCTFPRRDWDLARAGGNNEHPDFAGYFNECMNGFEYQVASHLLWEGLALEGLAVARAVDDRYASGRRNPWNEVEWGDHYARSMASHGVFLAACGFEYHGPKGALNFAPRLSPENFRAPFTVAEGWGTFTQNLTRASLHASVEMKWGRLRLRTLGLTPTGVTAPVRVAVTLGGKPLAVTSRAIDGRVTAEFAEAVVIETGQRLELVVSPA